MAVWRRALDQWLRDHHGVISTPQLRGVGCSARTAHRMVQRGELVPLLPGVFLSAQWPCGDEQRLVAVCARNPAAVIAFTTAARYWGYRKVNDRRLHVLVPHGCSPTMPGVVVHRCRRIDAVDIVERPDGIRLTSPPRTLFDSADMLGLSAARS
ncbi:MAG: type IV toxin-antitoxin system AbiEi family antitoxin domain-containing protein, partial [Actinomycetota bacterium]